MKQYLSFLHKTLSVPAFKRIWRTCFSSLQDLLLNDLLLKQDFTTLGAARLKQDLSATRNIISAYYSTESLFPKLFEGVALLNLPVEGEDGEVTIKEAIKAFYSTAENTESVLKQLGLSRLTNYEARCIFQRRVEAND